MTVGECQNSFINKLCLEGLRSCLHDGCARQYGLDTKWWTFEAMGGTVPGTCSPVGVLGAIAVFDLERAVLEDLFGQDCPPHGL